MGIVLGANEYGKAETRVVRVTRARTQHQIWDLNVSTSLRGDFTDAHVTGDQSHILPTDTQKNTAYAYAKTGACTDIEDYALELATHFVDDVAPVEGARVEVDEYAWDRVDVAGRPHPHAFVRRGQEIRTTVVTVESGHSGRHVWVVSGLKELVLLKSTGSQFRGFLTDPYTTLPETDDRVMATSLTARWRYASTDVNWSTAHAGIRSVLLATFADVHSLALQHTLWEMGLAALTAHPEVAEMRLSAPNRHHFTVDLTPFQLDNPNEVFHADDRPYGLIQVTVGRDDAPDAGAAWHTVTAAT
ncbi:MAG: urate oxidase [Acidothermales bacterium]|nr:urate oxidase [Acidothermales bacterium]